MNDAPKDLMQAYRAGAIVALIDDEANVFIAERARTAGAWQLPQGGIDEGEEPYQGALRELFEETGIPETDTLLLAQTPFWTWYNFPDENKAQRDSKRPEFAHLKGARHLWFFLKFTGDKAEIDLNKAQDREFSQHKWVKPEWITEHTHPMRKPGYKAAFDYFFTKGILGL